MSEIWTSEFQYFKTCPVFRRCLKFRHFHPNFRCPVLMLKIRGTRQFQTVHLKTKCFSAFHTLKKLNVSEKWTQRSNFRQIGAETCSNQVSSICLKFRRYVCFNFNLQHQASFSVTYTLKTNGNHWTFSHDVGLLEWSNSLLLISEIFKRKFLPPNIGNFRF